MPPTTSEPTEMFTMLPHTPKVESAVLIVGKVAACVSVTLSVTERQRRRNDRRVRAHPSSHPRNPRNPRRHRCPTVLRPDRHSVRTRAVRLPSMLPVNLR